MEIRTENGDTLSLLKENDVVGVCRFAAHPDRVDILAFRIVAAWRRRGYGSFLLKQLLHRTGGYQHETASLHIVPAPQESGAQAFWRKFSFVPEGGVWVRRRMPELTAVHLAQQFIAERCPAPRFCIDATCGNGGDTAFLCRLAAPCGGHVLGIDIQPEACRRTEARLAAEGFSPDTYQIVCGSHAELMCRQQPESADIILFNFGWLPGAAHDIFSTPESSLPAVRAALHVLRPGGILSAVLYSGKTIGNSEKQALKAFFASLPLMRFTVLCCDFANWADTAPLPCFVLKKQH